MELESDDAGDARLSGKLMTGHVGENVIEGLVGLPDWLSWSQGRPTSCSFAEGTLPWSAVSLRSCNLLLAEYTLVCVVGHEQLS